MPRARLARACFEISATAELRQRVWPRIDPAPARPQLTRPGHHALPSWPQISLPGSRPSSERSRSPIVEGTAFASATLSSWVLLPLVLYERTQRVSTQPWAVWRGSGVVRSGSDSWLSGQDVISHGARRRRHRQQGGRGGCSRQARSEGRRGRRPLLFVKGPLCLAEVRPRPPPGNCLGCSAPASWPKGQTPSLPHSARTGHVSADPRAARGVSLCLPGSLCELASGIVVSVTQTCVGAPLTHEGLV
jgi:hypothetical protein